MIASISKDERSGTEMSTSVDSVRSVVFVTATEGPSSLCLLALHPSTTRSNHHIDTGVFCGYDVDANR